MSERSFVLSKPENWVVTTRSCSPSSSGLAAIYRSMCWNLEGADLGEGHREDGLRYAGEVVPRYWNSRELGGSRCRSAQATADWWRPDYVMTYV